MNRISISISLLVVCAICTLLLHRPQPAHAQNDPGKGWIEGIVVNEKGDPLGGVYSVGTSYSPVSITIRSTDGKGVKTDSDRDKGGFYTFRDLRPGVYEVFIDKSVLNYKGDNVNYRPIHIFGLVVEADRRTELNINVHEGSALETIGKPSVPAQPAIIISEELAKLQRQIDDLRKR